MNFDLKKPCKDCPFRTDNGFILTNSRVREITQAVAWRDQTFSCHKTIQHDNDTGEGIEGRKTQHCAGALIMLEHMERPNQMMRIAERCGFYDRTALDMQSPVFNNDIEMCETYERRNQ